MHGIEPEDPAVLEKANALYWQSDRSVNQIADELGLSKGSLYAAIDPQATDLACAECGGPLVVPNRTAQERGLYFCAACDHSVVADEALPASALREDADPEEITVSASPGELRAAQGGRLLAGTALVGLALGVVIGRAIGRR